MFFILDKKTYEKALLKVTDLLLKEKILTKAYEEIKLETRAHVNNQQEKN